ncbi:branched-subunit amino acid aminotransferase/4-amino-4-deoxychorismate lyase [Hamadaea flava]|uniref:Aminotransferase class IV n=1 Tax=Hamadaea flava TaxID=1742688 RepID=A0ABV8LTE0_9ACTN|nr:aminotransferase class IV [Hamadaea flava]MCP2328687.1 branched-subunit amino acid aminotransferase/4-amino-4-deoxychorismate lyase [Hamadaea flava]
MDLITVEVDGAAATPAQLETLAFAPFGHFTAMQVRDGRVRGLDLHLARLAQADDELFGAKVDGERVRALIRHALGDLADASVRVLNFGDQPGDPVTTVVTVRPPFIAPVTTSLLPVDYSRTVAHLKRTNDFGQAYWGRRAARAGFGDALLVTPGGAVAEAGIANVGFWDGAAIVWPEAPMLRGITLQVVQPRLALPQHHQVIRLAQLTDFPSAFVTNSRGIAAVTRIGDHEYAVDAELMRELHRAYESAPADLI